MFYSESEIDFSQLEKKLSPVTIVDDEYTVTYGYARLELPSVDKITEDDEEKTYYSFIITPISDEEMALTQGLNFIAEHVLTDEQALQVPYIFDDWDQNNVRYTKDVSRVQYNGKLYKCITTHDSQLSWNPADSPSLWVRIDDPSIEWPEWVRPIESQTAYSKGDKVSWNGKHWVSTVEGEHTNTWEPGVFGWDEVTEESAETV